MTRRSDGRLDRRALLVRGGAFAGVSSVAGVAGYLGGRRLSETGESADARADSSTELFALDPNVVNLTTFLLATHPRPVREAIERHRSALDARAATYLRDQERELDESARQSAAAYLGGSADDVALTDSTTMGLGLVYAGLRLSPGDEVVTTEHDFYATHEALRLRHELDGVDVRRIRLYREPEAASASAMVTAVSKGLGPRTRCLALTWVHSSSGVKIPLPEIAAVVRRANRGRRPAERVLLVVDGVHGFGVDERAVAETGADVFISGCHKWLFGPRGTGLVWARPAAWRRLRPTIPTFEGAAYLAWLDGREPTDVAPARLMTPGGFHSFELRWALREAFGVHDAAGGRAQVARTTHALARRLKQGLAEIRGVAVKTPMDDALSAGLVCAEVEGLAPEQVVDELREEHRVIASVTPYATRYVRFGPSIANSETDVDRAIEAMTAVVRR